MSLIASFEIPRYLRVIEVELFFKIVDNTMRYSSELPIDSQMYQKPLFLKLCEEIFLFLILTSLPPSLCNGLIY